jgi:hypothetical protein
MTRTERKDHLAILSETALGRTNVLIAELRVRRTRDRPAMTERRRRSVIRIEIWAS